MFPIIELFTGRPVFSDKNDVRRPDRVLFFNLGVEVGQLVFVAAVMTAGGLFRRAMALRLEPVLVKQKTVNRLDVTAAHAIGAVAACWLIERTFAFFV